MRALSHVLRLSAAKQGIKMPIRTLWWGVQYRGARSKLFDGAQFQRRAGAVATFRALSASANGVNGDGIPEEHAARKRAMQVLLGEASALRQVAGGLGDGFDAAVALLEAMPASGRVVVSGVGKSGHIGQKVAASFSSTGTPAFFMHSYEALHGDMGGVVPGDISILISYSGGTPEVIHAAHGFKQRGAITIAMTRSPDSPLALACDVCIPIGTHQELDHNRVAPTASTIATMALGDALAVVLSERRGFDLDQFASSHPGGVLGQYVQAHSQGGTRAINPLSKAPADNSYAAGSLQTQAATATAHAPVRGNRVLHQAPREGDRDRRFA